MASYRTDRTRARSRFLLTLGLHLKTLCPTAHDVWPTFLRPSNDRRLLMMFACAMSKRGGWLLLVSPTLCNPRTHRCGTYFDYFDCANFYYCHRSEFINRARRVSRRSEPRSLFFYERMNKSTLWDFGASKRGRADIERSKSKVALNTSVPRATHSCADCWDTSGWILQRPEGSMGHTSTTGVRL